MIYEHKYYSYYYYKYWLLKCIYYCNYLKIYNYHVTSCLIESLTFHRYYSTLIGCNPKVFVAEVFGCEQDW